MNPSTIALIAAIVVCLIAAIFGVCDGGAGGETSDKNHYE